MLEIFAYAILVAQLILLFKLVKAEVGRENDSYSKIEKEFIQVINNTKVIEELNHNILTKINAFLKDLSKFVKDKNGKIMTDDDLAPFAIELLNLSTELEFEEDGTFNVEKYIAQLTDEEKETLGLLDVK